MTRKYYLAAGLALPLALAATAGKAAETSNGITVNALSYNTISWNALSWNAIPLNGVAPHDVGLSQMAHQPIAVRTTKRPKSEAAGDNGRRGGMPRILRLLLNR